MFINKRKRNNALHCEAYSFFEGVASDHRIISAKITSKNAVGHDESMEGKKSMEVWKARKFDDTLRLCNAVYKQNSKKEINKKGGFGISKKCRGITLTSMAAKVYNALLLYCIQHEIEKILTNNQNDSPRNRSATSQILTLHRIIEGI